jgi:dihydrodipicolinate synthase/N-acetylneuraminate lyase
MVKARTKSVAGATTEFVAGARAGLLRRLFPEGVPTLWCPPLAHYDEAGRIDAKRIAAHLKHLSQHIKGFLIPGSTGDGWELSQPERRQVLEIALEQAQRLKAHMLIGVLKPQAAGMQTTIREDLEWLKACTGERDIEKALAASRVRGFTVCPPHGQDLTQSEIRGGLVSILEMGLPTAIYQLPQITKNEMSAEVAQELAQRFENFLWFKDSSGSDRVALSGDGLGGVFTMRGGEGDYARWLTVAGGPYEGFLLGSANVFARELYQIIQDISTGRLQAARQLSDRVTAAVGEVAPLVSDLPAGTAFACANKALDHFFAYGPRAAGVPPPRTHGGGRLSVELIRAAGKILERHGLLPSKGYLELDAHGTTVADSIDRLTTGEPPA